MSIYEGSRYTNVFAYDEEYKGKNITSFYIRTLPKINFDEAIKHTWIESDRLDLLADRYYGDSQYWWFILDSNTQYMEEHQIQNGDILMIPSYEELRKVVVDNGDQE